MTTDEKIETFREWLKEKTVTSTILSKFNDLFPELTFQDLEFGTFFVWKYGNRDVVHVKLSKSKYVSIWKNGHLLVQHERFTNSPNNSPNDSVLIKEITK